MILLRLPVTGRHKRVAAYYGGGRQVVATVPEPCTWEDVEAAAEEKFKQRSNGQGQ